jgi:hypothetical protein
MFFLAMLEIADFDQKTQGILEIKYLTIFKAFITLAKQN